MFVGEVNVSRVVIILKNALLNGSVLTAIGFRNLTLLMVGKSITITQLRYIRHNSVLLGIKMYHLTLECGHSAVTDIDLTRLQSVAHYVWCIPCRERKAEPQYDHVPIGITWCKVLDINEVSAVPTGTTFVLPEDILRLQHGNTPTARVRPFPYVLGPSRRRGLRRSPRKSVN